MADETTHGRESVIAKNAKEKALGSRFRGNDEEKWIPAFAGTTKKKWIPASAGMTGKGRKTPGP